MNYRKFGKTGCEVSPLGFGCMRFPTTPEGNIDRPRAIAMLRHAIDNGLNYVDTAFGYHREESEGLVGEALQDGYREKTFLATKMPLWKVHEPADFDRILQIQLDRLKTDHIDFYLLHAVNADTWHNTVLKHGLLEKMEKAKRDGVIGHIGFSFHDTHDTFMEILDGYDGWEFCQIQYNYINTDYQAGQAGLHAAAARGLGVVIMEPLLGGRLANPPARVAECLPQGKTPVEAALDFLWTQEEITITLSGMSTEEQLAQNLEYAERSDVGMLNKEEFAAYGKAKAVFDHMALVPCTGCEYCLPCPFGVQIPSVFSAYNRTVANGNKAALAAYEAVMGKADLCKACKRCEKLCPQHIGISDMLPKIATCFAEIDAAEKARAAAQKK